MPLSRREGSASALQTLATRSAVTTEVAYEADGRLPETVELAAYFVAGEALTNVAKYAEAGSAQVRVWRDGRSVYAEVSDDGVGGADDQLGTGLRGAGRPRGGARRQPALREPGWRRNRRPRGDAVRVPTGGYWSACTSK